MHISDNVIQNRKKLNDSSSFWECFEQKKTIETLFHLLHIDHSETHTLTLWTKKEWTKQKISRSDYKHCTVNNEKNLLIFFRLVAVVVEIIPFIYFDFTWMKKDYYYYFVFHCFTPSVHFPFVFFSSNINLPKKKTN